MTLPPIQITILVDDLEAAGTIDDLRNGLPTILDGLSFSWGRDSVVDQPDAGSATFTVRQQIIPGQQPSVFNQLHAGSVVRIEASGGGRDVLCWVGEITTITAQFVGDHAVAATVSCVDAAALLSNVTIGDEPWPQQSAYDRFLAILDAAGLRIHELVPAPSWSYTLTGDIDATIRAPQIAARDVDAQPPLDLFQSLAASVGGAAWVTADESGPYLWIEDVANRPGLKQFWIDPISGIVYIRDAGYGTDNADTWSASDILRDPIIWTQDPTQAITTVEVSWLEPGVDDQGLPTSTEQIVDLSDPGMVERYGLRQISIATELADVVDARQLAADWIGSSMTADWVVTGLNIDTAVLTRATPGLPADVDATRLDKVMDLLDIRARIGHRLSVIDFPDYAPTGAAQSYYLEGGTYTWENHRWQLDLTGSSNVGMGGSAIYEEFPDGVTWEDFDPMITWLDCYGVAAPDPPATEEIAA